MYIADKSNLKENSHVLAKGWHATGLKMDMPLNYLMILNNVLFFESIAVVTPLYYNKLTYNSTSKVVNFLFCVTLPYKSTFITCTQK